MIVAKPSDFGAESGLTVADEVPIGLAIWVLFGKVGPDLSQSDCLTIASDCQDNR